ncbi:MAG: DsbA family protein [Gammaproteobacteria bacterium]
MTVPQVEHYFDYKSPYAWLAQLANDTLERELGITVTRVPYTLDIPAYLGAAELDAQGEDVIGTRNAHQWRRVRYSYMDCRREANRRGLVLRGPRRIFDSRLAHAGFLYAANAGVWRAYHDEVYVRFWRRELDLEDGAALAELLTRAGADGRAFAGWFEAIGRTRLAALQAAAEARGVFGVPSWLVDGELYWGAERIERVREKIALRLRAG